MVKRLFLLLLVALLVCFSSAFASVGTLKEGVPQGAATDINIYGGVQSFDGSTLTVGVLGMAGGGAVSQDIVSQMVSGSTAVPVAYGIVLKYAGAITQAGTLADGVPGQVLMIIINQLDLGASYILTPTHKTGFATLTFNAVGDSATLLYVNDGRGWVLVSYNSVTVGQ